MPVDINNANPKTLLPILEWPKERFERFLKERTRRPFENLADLQERGLAKLRPYFEDCACLVAGSVTLKRQI